MRATIDTEALHKIELIETCGACPEQYDAVFEGKMVGYLRLRHGYFYVQCPDVGGTTVFEARPNGDGLFEYEEREMYLNAAKTAILDWLKDGGEPAYTYERVGDNY
jgi:hypothetical protein